jgi:hypothetical protein
VSSEGIRLYRKISPFKARLCLEFASIGVLNSIDQQCSCSGSERLRAHHVLKSRTASAAPNPVSSRRLESKRTSLWMVAEKDRADWDESGRSRDDMAVTRDCCPQLSFGELLHDAPPREARVRFEYRITAVTLHRTGNAKGLNRLAPAGTAGFRWAT